MQNASFQKCLCPKIFPFKISSFLDCNQIFVTLSRLYPNFRQST